MTKILLDVPEALYNKIVDKAMAETRKTKVKVTIVKKMIEAIEKGEPKIK